MNHSELKRQVWAIPHVAELADGDKKHAILLALKTWPDRSQREIAEQIGCSQPWVCDIKKQVIGAYQLPDHVTGKDGKGFPAL